MTLRTKLPALAMLAAFLLPGIALAQTVSVPKGGTITALMNTTLNSGNAYVGQKFTARVVNPYPDNDPTFANAVVTGEVIKVTPAGQGRTPELDLAFNTITLQNGASYPLNAQMTNAQTKHESRSGGHVALTTIGGMVLGNIIGKTIFHTNAGGAIGAASGFLVGYNKKSNVTLPTNAQLTLTLTRPLLVRRQAGQPY